MAAAIGGGVGIGAGVGVSSVALMPFNTANTFLGSAFFGYGMILGERYMYQADWPKIQARLEHGEKIENIIQEYTGVFTAVVMKEAKIIFDTVTQEMLNIMKQAFLDAFPDVQPPKQTEEELRRRGRGGPADSSPPPFVVPQPPPKISGGVKLPPIEVPQFKIKQEETNRRIDKIIATAPKVKIKAGQSQIKERLALIQHIHAIAQNLPKVRPQGGKEHKKQIAAMQATQVKLAQLLLRYQF